MHVPDSAKSYEWLREWILQECSCTPDGA